MGQKSYNTDKVTFDHSVLLMVERSRAAGIGWKSQALNYVIENEKKLCPFWYKFL